MEVKELIAGIEAKHKTIEDGLKATGAQAAEGKAAAEKALDELKTQTNRLLEIEQKLAERVQKGQEAPETLGMQLIKSAPFKAFVEGTQTKASFEAKNTILTQTPAGASDGTLVAPNRLAGIVGGPMRPMTILDLLPSGPTTSNAIEFTKETVFTPNAAPVADGDAAPESDLEFSLESLPVRAISHLIYVSKQVLSDAPALANYVDVRMRYGVRLAVENQVVAGNGTGQNLSGMLKTGNHTVFTPVEGDTALDSINRGIEKAEIALYPADVIMLNPADWYAILRSKTTTGEYVLGEGAPFSGVIAQNLWGKPVVTSVAIPAGKFVVASLAFAYQFWERQTTQVEIFDQNKDLAEKGLVTIKGSARGALATYRPASAFYGSLLAA